MIDITSLLNLKEYVELQKHFTDLRLFYVSKDGAGNQGAYLHLDPGEVILGSYKIQTKRDTSKLLPRPPNSYSDIYETLVHITDDVALLIGTDKRFKEDEQKQKLARSCEAERLLLIERNELLKDKDKLTNDLTKQTSDLNLKLSDLDRVNKMNFESRQRLEKQVADLQKQLRKMNKHFGKKACDEALGLEDE